MKLPFGLEVISGNNSAVRAMDDDGLNASSSWINDMQTAAKAYELKETDIVIESCISALETLNSSATTDPMIIVAISFLNYYLGMAFLSKGLKSEAIRALHLVIEMHKSPYAKKAKLVLQRHKIM